MKGTRTNRRPEEKPNADKLAAEVTRATADLKTVATRAHDKLGDHKAVINHWGARWGHLNNELPEAIAKLAAFSEASSKFADFVDVAAADMYKLSNGWKEDFTALIGLAQMFSPNTQDDVDALQQSYKMEYENAKKVSETLRGLSAKASNLRYYLNQLQTNLQKLPVDQREKNANVIPLIRSAFKCLSDGCGILEKCTPPTIYSEPFFMTTAAEGFQSSITIMGAVNSTPLVRWTSTA